MTAHVRNPGRIITLDDKYAALDGPVYLTGIQALVRLPLDQIRRDRAAGLKTAGFVSGYRGSPLGGYDQQLERAKAFLDAHDVLFRPGINEELAATAVWGTQKVTLRPGATREGVFGIWYGKSPGVDRCGDVMRHANMSGTAARGGVLAIAGDDHLAKSSSLPHQSEFAFVDWEIPVLSPADIQEVLDYGLYGIALSRHAGTWAALIAVTEAMDSSAVISVDPARMGIVAPEKKGDPRVGTELNRLMLLGNRHETEVLMREVRLPAARAFVRANRLDRQVFGAARPRFGIVASGKAYRDLMQTLDLLGIDEAAARRIGLAVYKVAMPWPLEPEGLRDFASGLERLLVVENKRALIEPQIKEQAYHWPASERPGIWGKRTPQGEPLVPEVRDLGAPELGPVLLRFLPEAGLGSEARASVARLAERTRWAAQVCAEASRSPFFCSGCPYNVATRTPEGSRSFSGIGCHVMTDLIGRTTEGSAQMGGEGVHWLGEFPFTGERHVFVNLGEGTYHHSGSMAIRAAVAAKAPMTFKIVFNDAVAMTGGQAVDGPLSVAHIARQLAAEGVEKIVVVAEEPERHTKEAPAPGVPVLPRAELMRVQEELRAYPGVSALIYDQTCAAEKRRRRKAGQYPDPDRRVFINEEVCEACGDCSAQSSCISVEPVATPFGEKRRINQSSCNKDFSCTDGFCPSFVTVEGAELRSGEANADIDARVAALPVPDLPVCATPYNLLLTGVGGTGITTASAILAMAAHLDGRNATTLDMTGLAQKGGPVTSQVRIAPAGTPIHGPRVPVGALDLLLASDLLVAAEAKTLELTDAARSRAVLNSRVAPTAEFVLHQTQSHSPDRLAETVSGACAQTWQQDFAGLAQRLFGDAIYANMMLIGFAWQKGLVPVSLDALEKAIALNGVAVARNRNAFRAGRLVAVDDKAFAVEADAPAPADMPLDQRIAFLAGELAAYQDRRYADTFLDFIERVRTADARAGGALTFTRAVAEGLYRLMAYKDEYEVARLYSSPDFKTRLEAQFAGHGRISVALAPPLIARRDRRSGRLRKMRFGPWIFPFMRALAKFKGLRGSLLDPFGHTTERRAERALIGTYRELIERLLPDLQDGDYALAVRIAETARLVRGYGPIKAANMAKARAEQARLRDSWQKGRGTAGRERPVLMAAE